MVINLQPPTPLDYDPLTGLACAATFSSGGETLAAAYYVSANTNVNPQFRARGLPIGATLDTAAEALDDTWEVWTAMPSEPGAVQLYAGAHVDDAGQSPVRILLLAHDELNVAFSLSVHDPGTAYVVILRALCVGTTAGDVVIPPSGPGFEAGAVYEVYGRRVLDYADTFVPLLGAKAALTIPRLGFSDRGMVITRARHRIWIDEGRVNWQQDSQYWMQRIPGTNIEGEDVAVVGSAIVGTSVVAGG